MRPRRLEAHNFLLGLSLVIALGVLCCGVMFPISMDSYLKSVATHKAKPVQPSQPSVVHDVVAKTSRHKVFPKPDAATGPDQRGEMPFAFGTTANPVGFTSTGSDPVAMCAALRGALANGSGEDLAAIRTRLLALGVDAVSAISTLLHCGEEKVEAEAVRLLSQIGAPEALARAMGKLLTVPRDSPTYGHFLAAFADNHSPAVAQWLTKTLGQTQHAETRERILDILYAMSGPEIVEALEQSALNPQDDLHAKDSREFLAIRHDPSEAEGLADLLESADESIGEAAAYGLAHIGSSEACQILADYADDYPDYTDALASISSTYAQEALLSLATTPTRSAFVRVSAVQSLASQSSQRVRTVLVNAVIQEPNTIVADAMRAALITLATDEAEQGEVTSSDNGYEGELWF